MSVGVFPFYVNDTATTDIYTLSLHDALPISHISDVEFYLVAAGDALLVEREDLATREIGRAHV